MSMTVVSLAADVEGEEEECEVASEADDAAEEQRVTKQTSGKKREKKAKQQKLNKKQKAGAGAEGFDDEDLKHGEVAGRSLLTTAAARPFIPIWPLCGLSLLSNIHAVAQQHLHTPLGVLPAFPGVEFRWTAWCPRAAASRHHSC